MIADTTFLVDYHNEQSGRKTGPASKFLHAHRAQQLITTVISAGEFAAGFDELRARADFFVALADFEYAAGSRLRRRAG